MVTSMILVPHVAHMDEADVTLLVQFRMRERERRNGLPGGHLTLLAFVMKAVTAGLRAAPAFNASLDPFSEEIVYKKYYNVGFAADTGKGLIVPVVKDTDRQSILQISQRVEELAGRALSDLEEQYRSWKDMAVFKRQWIQRDFKKGAGMPAEQWLDSFRALSTAIAERDASRIGSLSLPLDNLIAQYIHMMEMLSEYEKDPAKLSVGKKAIERWIDDAEALRDVLSPLRSG